ncbi:MAG: hypothetical protein ACE5K4_12650 [Candidatus Hydrothermarchaeota archaeon]
MAITCSHVSSSDLDWLPYQSHGGTKGLIPHPHCIKCGVVKNVSSDRAKKIGYYTNALSSMAKHLEKRGVKNITQVQIRLIIKELESIEDFEDTYVITGSTQRRIFIDIVKKYCNLSEEFIKSFL